MITFCRQSLGTAGQHAQKEQAAQQSVKKALAVLEAYLQTRTFLVGDAVTLADIVMYANLWLGFTMVRLCLRGAFSSAIDAPTWCACTVEMLSLPP